MTPADAAAALRGRADNIAIQRARLAGVMRTIFDMGGLDLVKACTAAEIERLPASVANDNANWIG